MDSVRENNVKVDSPDKKISEISFQQQENYHDTKNICLDCKNDEEVVISANGNSPDNKAFQTSIARNKNELIDVRNAASGIKENPHNDVSSSPEIEQHLQNDPAELKPTSKKFDFASGDKLSQELSETYNSSENIGDYRNPASKYCPPDYKRDDKAYFLLEESGLEESGQSDSSSSLSSCDASFSHSDDEDEDSEKICSVQSTPNSGFTITYNDFQKSTKPVQSIKNNVQSNLIEERVKETKICSSQDDTKTASEVLLQKNTETNVQRFRVKSVGKNCLSQNETEMRRSCNIGDTFHKSRHATTNSTNATKNQDIAEYRRSPENSNFIKPVERPSAIATAFPKSRAVATINPAKISKNQEKDAVAKSSENNDFVKPDEETAANIVSRVEFYFTDFNILKNNFLLKYIRKNKEGYVSLKLVTSFRKVKAVTKDWRVVAYSLAYSKLLKLNTEKTKVRRIEPIPKIEDTSFGKTVVVFNLPYQKQFSEQIKELFGKFGNIVHAEVMTPKSKNYNSYHAKCLFFNRDVATETFGVVEFENYKDAQSALKDEESCLPKENKMVVVPLVAKYYRFKPRKSFRYKSSVSYPRNAYDGFGKVEHPRDIYAVNGPNVAKYDRYCYYDERMPKRNYLYRDNYGYYPQQQSYQRYFYPKQRLIANNIPENKYAHKCSNGSIEQPENWRQNRYLMANNSMNIDKRYAYSSRKTEAN